MSTGALLRALAIEYGNAANTATIATGVLTVSRFFTTAAAETGTTDTIDTITAASTMATSANGDNYGHILLLTADAGDTITLADGSGNINIPKTGNIVLVGNDKDMALLVYDGTHWVLVADTTATFASGTFTDLVVTSTATFASATIADLGTVTTADFTDLAVTATATFAGATIADLGTVTTAAINGGTINNTVVGGVTPAAGTFTTLTTTSTVVHEKDGANQTTTLTSYGGTAQFSAQKANGTKSLPTAVASANVIYQERYDGYDGSTFIPAGTINIVARENWSVGNNGAAFRLKLTPNGSASVVQVFVVDHNGHVGIGASSAPSAKLHVQGEADEVQLQVTGNGTQTSLVERIETSVAGALRTLSNAGDEVLTGALDVGTTLTVGSDAILDSLITMLADQTSDVAPNDDTTRKKLSVQRLAAAPTNAAYILFANSPGTPTNDFYLVLEEG